MNYYKKIIRDFLPPVLLRAMKPKNTYGWFGNYSTWDEAQKKSEGYDSDIILQKVKASLIKVKNGEARYERDSVTFQTIEYSWPMLAAIMWVASQNKGKLNVLDFGGSLGSSYFQNRKFFSKLGEIKWNIIEQKKFVECGKSIFETEELKFYLTITDCLKEQSPQVALLSCVLPYVSSPYKVIQEIYDAGIPYVVLDRMPFINQKNDRITIQRVPPQIYPAAYPSWFFSENKFKGFLENKYDIIEDFKCEDVANIKGSYYKGLILHRKHDVD